MNFSYNNILLKPDAAYRKSGKGKRSFYAALDFGRTGTGEGRGIEENRGHGSHGGAVNGGEMEE